MLVDTNIQIRKIEKCISKIFLRNGHSIPIHRYDPYIVPFTLLKFDFLSLKYFIDSKDYIPVDDVLEIRPKYCIYQPRENNLQINFLKSTNREYIENLIIQSEDDDIFVVSLNESDEYYRLNIKLRDDSLVNIVMKNIYTTGCPNINLVYKNAKFKEEVLKAKERYQLVIKDLYSSHASLNRNKEIPYYLFDACARFSKLNPNSFIQVYYNKNTIERLDILAKDKLEIYRDIYFTPLNNIRCIESNSGQLQVDKRLVNLFSFFIKDLDSDLVFNTKDIFTGKYLKKEY